MSGSGNSALAYLGLDATNAEAAPERPEASDVYPDDPSPAPARALESWEFFYNTIQRILKFEDRSLKVEGNSRDDGINGLQVLPEEFFQGGAFEGMFIPFDE